MSTDITRRGLLQAGLGALPLLALPRVSARAASAPAALPEGARRPNLLLLFTDQQREPRHWPAGFVEKHLPSFARLGRHGLAFRNAFTSACECTPSRASLLTSTYPTVHGVTQTFSTQLVADGVSLQTHQQNLCRLLGAAGYHVEYKGKWHESLPIGRSWTDADAAHLERLYGVPGWNPPDAGNSITDLTTLGGANPDNDGRYVSGVTPGAAGQVPGFGRSVLDFLNGYDGEKPFCLIVSLVNPHDVEFFPNGWDAAGYRLESFQDLGIGLPSNHADSLEDKPAVQGVLRGLKDGLAPLTDERWRLHYVNFYAYLQTVVDRHIMTILDALDARGLTEDTVVFRFADHGELGLSHGLREKVFTAYDEMIHVPLIVSNPAWYPAPLETEALYSHVDLLPTVARIAGIPQSLLDGLGCVGKDMAPVLKDPSATVQDSVLFSFDDARTFVETYRLPQRIPSRIRVLREKGWTYAVYFDAEGSHLEHELYDLTDDPGQLRNLAFEPPRPGSSLARERARLHEKLSQALVSKNALPPGFRWPADPLATSAG